MTSRLIAALPALMLASGCAYGEAVKVDEYHWTGVDRVLAIGDLHGDYEQYIKVLQSAGLVNSRGKWTGRDAHLVQTGDIPDRGPSSRAIIDHLADLKKQAAKKGGRVHTLIGNHEAMNTYGDLRYAHPGEFEAFKGRNSEQIREKQWDFQLQRIKQVKPEEFLVMDLEQYRQEWEKQVPLGWVEHRLAWQPAGEYGQWVTANPVAIMVNDTVYLHGGLSPEYCRLSLQELTEQAWQQIRNYDRAITGVIDDENGPLWYRGLAKEDEDSFSAVLDQILERYGASRIVVGHTPTGGVVWPRFDGRVVVNDTGIGAHYGSNDAYLELSENSAWAGYGDHKFVLPPDADGRVEYLREVIGIRPENTALQERLAIMLSPPSADDAAGSAAQGGEAATGETPPAIPDPAGETISPGICQ
jgi:hypothetical protein